MADIDHLAHLTKKLETLPREGWRVLGAPGAVLIPFIKRNGEWLIVLTKRSDSLSRHSGEISFPGGMVDDGEDSREAALREASEEVGIPPDKVQVLGKLQSVHTIVSGVLIDPWVGVVPELSLVPNPDEIEELLEIPLVELLDPAAYRVQKFIRAGVIYPSPAFDVSNKTIWGATARILRNLLDLFEP